MLIDQVQSFSKHKFKYEYINAGFSLSEAHIAWLKESMGNNSLIGLDTEFYFSRLCLIQLGTDRKVLIIQISKNSKKSKKTIGLLKEILESANIIKAGAELWGDASLIYHNLGIKLNSGCDVTRIFNKGFSAKRGHFPTTKQRKGLFAMYNDLYPSANPLKKDSETTVSKWNKEILDQRQLEYAALDAYVSYMVGMKAVESNPEFDKINFNGLKDLKLFTAFHVQLLDQESIGMSKVFATSFSDTQRAENGLKIVVTNDQFSNKLSFTDRVSVYFKKGPIIPGTVMFGKNGKTKTIKLDFCAPKSEVRKILVIDTKEGYAYDTVCSDLYFSNYFSGRVRLEDSSLLKEMYSRKKREEITDLEGALQGLKIDSTENLNLAQKHAIYNSLDRSTLINLIRGPPGTGKTTVISKTVSLGLEDNMQYIITAQSNAATLNLAVALKKNGVLDYCIIVSDNYYVEWHEEGYRDFISKVIQTSALNKDGKDTRLNSRVIISTISQLSNPKIGPSLVKKERLHLIIDEATQICQAVIPHILSNYADALLKVTFVGDEKQLSPFGSDQFSSIKSPFDVLSCSETFLNVTYRLPFELTSFISKHVYAKKLLPFKVSSTHPIAFVDIPGTENEPKPGKIMNVKEQKIAILLATKEFKEKDFLIITGYNQQRDDIKKGIKLAGLDEATTQRLCSKVRSVDSAQGQEADHIIFGVTRTAKVGFLKNPRRTNVALTRCKKSLIILGSFDFLEGIGSKTLIGKLYSEMKEKSKIISYHEVLNGKKIN